MKMILLTLLFSFIIVAQALAVDLRWSPSIPIVLIKIEKNGTTKDLSGLDNALIEEKGLKRERLNSALQRTIGKLSKVIHKVMKQNEDKKGKYILSEVEVGLSLSSEYGISDIVAVGGNANVVLHFSKN